MLGSVDTKAKVRILESGLYTHATGCGAPELASVSTRVKVRVLRRKYRLGGLPARECGTPVRASVCRRVEVLAMVETWKCLHKG